MLLPLACYPDPDNIRTNLSGVWCSHFGIRTMERCNDWVSERSVFESALNVCPDGVKILNNLASQMLNTEEAERAQELLERALRVRQDVEGLERT